MNFFLLLGARFASVIGCLTIAWWALAAAHARNDVVPVWMARKWAVLMGFDAAINLAALIVLAGHVTEPQTTWLFVGRGIVHLLIAGRLLTSRRDLTHVLTAEQAVELGRANEVNRALLETIEHRLAAGWQAAAMAAGWRPPS